MPSLANIGGLARLLLSKRGPKRTQDAVLSFNVQARLTGSPRTQPQFEVLVRHLFDRLLNNEAFGEDAALRVAQLAYAVVLPGVLVALFLFPAYHGLPPHPIERPFWAQAADHLFYITYSLVILGTAMVFQWDLLFPDLLDLFILSTLPLSRLRLLLARISAFALFLALVLLGTTGLTDLFFPAVADLKVGFFRHLLAHTLAVSLAGLFAALLLVVLQSTLLCLPSRRLLSTFIPTLKTLSIVTLLTLLFLFPLTAHFLPDLLGSPIARLFPPFWFLGLYHVILYGPVAQPVFHQLAHLAVDSIATLTALATLTYPLAYTRRVRQLIEGAPLPQQPSRVTAILRRILHRTIVRTPRSRAIFHFAAQTLARLQRLHLYLAMYAGLGLALVLSGLIIFHLDRNRLAIAISPVGIRLAIPVLAFWIVAGLRTALLSPLGRAGSWLFRVIRGQPEIEDLRGVELFVRTVATTVTLLTVVALHPLSPPELRGPIPTLGQVLVAIGLSLLLTDLFFLTVRSIPFTATRPSSTRELPLTLVRYFVLFPALALYVAGIEPWIESSIPHLLFTACGIAAAHLALAKLRSHVLQLPAPVDDLLLTGLDLQGD